MGWGLKILGGPRIRKAHFRRDLSPILVEVDGSIAACNVDKDSFWTHSCGELINVQVKSWIRRKGLMTGDRVWLDVLEPFRKFRATTSSAAKRAA